MSARTLVLTTLAWLQIAASPLPPSTDLLPPLEDWNGASRRLAVPPESPWATPAEVSSLRRTPSYQETLDYLARLVDASEKLRWVSIGRSGEGRELKLVIASLEGASTPEALRANGRPTLLAQGGIHSGEIDGKDAGLMLLRDLTVGDRLDALERVNLLFLPIFNVDGHERSSAYGRINQRGPEEMGWRTNGRNLNLNRDYAKAETPEMQALIAAVERWQPDLYLDLHVTDGADYQYDVTFGWNGPHAYSPSIAGWLDEVYRPEISRGLREEGHVPGPLVFLADPARPEAGIWGWTAGPRFSNGWGDARQLPTVLVENHSLKPYDRRVLGTYVLLRETLDLLGREGEGLREAMAADRARRPAELALGWKEREEDLPTTSFLAIESRVRDSEITGDEVPSWTAKPYEVEAKIFLADVPTKVVKLPVAYWIPPAWSDVARKLELQGIRVERMDEATDGVFEMYRLGDVELASEPFEGRVRVAATTKTETRGERFPVGSFRVPVAQPLGRLAALLLEPEAADSYFQWGYFLEILQRTEYAEAYVLEPLARRMMERDEELAKRFRKAIETDETLREDSRRRLSWFYEQTPYYDARYLLYPIAREMPRQE